MSRFRSNFKGIPVGYLKLNRDFVGRDKFAAVVTSWDQGSDFREQRNLADIGGRRAKVSSEGTTYAQFPESLQHNEKGRVFTFNLTENRVGNDRGIFSQELEDLANVFRARKQFTVGIYFRWGGVSNADEDSLIGAWDGRASTTIAWKHSLLRYDSLNGEIGFDVFMNFADRNLKATKTLNTTDWQLIVGRFDAGVSSIWYNGEKLAEIDHIAAAAGQRWIDNRTQTPAPFELVGGHKVTGASRTDAPRIEWAYSFFSIDALADGKIEALGKDPTLLFAAEADPLELSSPPASVTLSYLRPNSDDLTTGWEGDAGETTNLFQKLDETVADDSDFVRSPSNPSSSIARFGISNPTVGVDTAQPVTLRTRYRLDGSGTMDVTVRLKEGTTTRATWTYNGISMSFFTSSEVLSSGVKSAITNCLILVESLPLSLTSLSRGRRQP